MKFKTRYKLWKVALGVVAGGLVMFLIYSAYKYAEAGEKTTAPMPEAGTNSDDEDTYIGAPFMFLYIVGLFYFALNYYYSLLVEYKKFFSFLKITALLFLGSFAYHLFLYYFIPSAMAKSYESPFHILGSLFSSMIPMLILSFLIAYITNMREAVKQRRILQQQKLELEAQISQANFNFLKAQINPHFLHNTLNFLYAKSLPYSPELSEGILTLSDIMRYALSQGNQKDGKAPLKDEIEHVQNVIRISQLRFSNQLKVNIEITGDADGKMIIPFVLITLVENAFKHGDLKNTNYPIDIKVNISGDSLFFYCRNKKKSGPKQLSTGIGLDNIKKRLELAYGDGFTITIKDDSDFYTVELSINKLS